MLTLVVYILSFDVLSWHTIARDPMMLLFGGITSFMIVVAYRLEQEQEVKLKTMNETKLTIEELKELKQALNSYVHILTSLGTNVHLDKHYDKKLQLLDHRLSLMIAQKIYMERV
jgi:hypothetical protein